MARRFRKGERVTITVKMPVPYWEKFAAVSDERGLTRQDLGQEILEAYLDGLPMPQSLVDAQQELPMTA